MNSGAIFGLVFVMSFIAFGLVTKLYIWPRVRAMRTEEALIPLLVPHTFRAVGLSFLVPGVVSSPLATEFALPAGYGDLIAAVLAIIAIIALMGRTSWAIPSAWVFNVLGTADLLFAIYQGEIGAHIGAGALGATFFIPTVLVPPLLVLHGVIFVLLLRPKFSK